jgi:hypothetical protein
MASPDVLLDLQGVIEACLADKLQKGFDASAAISVDLATQVAKEIELRSSEYTDAEIAKLTDLIGGGDLSPLIDLLNTIKQLLDGNDDTTDGFDTFNKLVEDIATNKQTLVNHTTSISLIQSTLATFDSKLTDHENRIAALEAIDHTKTNCEECQDGVLNLVKDTMAAACTAASATIDSYVAGKTHAVSTAFADQLDPIAFSATASADDSNNTVLVSGTVNTGRRVKSIAVIYDGMQLWRIVPVKADGSYSGVIPAQFNPDLNPNANFYTLDENEKSVGAGLQVHVDLPETVNIEIPPVADPPPS